MNKSITSLLLSLLFFISNNGFSQECNVCNRYLDVIYDRVSIQKSEDFRESFKSWFFSKSFYNEIKGNKLGLSVTVPLEGIPVTFGGDYESNNAWEKREENMNSTNWDFSKISKEIIFTQVATAQSRDVWLQCVKAICGSQNERFHIESTVSDQEVLFTISYNANVIDGAPPVYESFVCNGLDCSSVTEELKGKPMKKAGEALKVKWLNQGVTEGSLVINTSRGSSKIYTVNRNLKLQEGFLAVVKESMGNLDNEKDLVKIGSVSEIKFIPGGSEDYNTVWPTKFSAAPEQTLRNFQYECLNELSWPCGWYKIDGEQRNGREVSVTTRTWGPSMRWKFSYDIYKARTILRQDSTSLKIVDNILHVTVPKNGYFPVITLRLQNGRDLFFNPQGKLPEGVLLSESSADENSYFYSFKIANASSNVSNNDNNIPPKPKPKPQPKSNLIYYVGGLAIILGLIFFIVRMRRKKL